MRLKKIIGRWRQTDKKQYTFSQTIPTQMVSKFCQAVAAHVHNSLVSLEISMRLSAEGKHVLTAQKPVAREGVCIPPRPTLMRDGQVVS